MIGKCKKKLQKFESDFAKFSPLLGFRPFSTYACPPKKLSTRVLHASACALGTLIDPCRGRELGCHVSHDLAAWCAKPRHRAPGGRGGAHANKFASRASTDEVGGPRRLAHTSGEREAAEARGNAVPHTSRSSVEPVQGSKRRARARWAGIERHRELLSRSAYTLPCVVGKLR